LEAILQDTFQPQPPEPVPQPETSATPSPAVQSIPPSAGASAFRDRSTGLTIFGILQIILGLFAAMLIPIALLGAFMSRLGPGGAMHVRQLFSGMVSYGSIAVIMITLGIGSIRARRWARALTIVGSWYWLIMGVLITILLTATLPVMMRTGLAQAQRSAGNAAPVPTIVMAVIVTLIIVFAAVLLIVVPIAFLVFYSRKDVEQTCRHRDPIERWTDRTPLPVLGASVVLFLGSLYLLLMAVTTPLFPFFGNYLTGIPAAICFFALATIDIYLSFAIYRLQSSGWWAAVILSPIRLISMAITFRRANLMQAYSKLGWSNAQLQVLNSNPMFRNHLILWWSLISLVLFFGYLVWLGRYFKAPTQAPSIADARMS
jgi:hypothetical protein